MVTMSKYALWWDEEYPVLDMIPESEGTGVWGIYEIPDELYREWRAAKDTIARIDEQVAKLVREQKE
jgi:hypothetical protein